MMRRRIVTARSIGRDSFVNDCYGLPPARDTGAHGLAQPSGEYRLRESFVNCRKQRPDLANVESGHDDDFTEKVRTIEQQRFHHFDAADFGQNDVEKDDVVLVIVQTAQRFFAVGSEVEGEIERLQQLPEKFAGGSIILDDQGT